MVQNDDDKKAYADDQTTDSSNKTGTDQSLETAAEGRESEVKQQIDQKVSTLQTTFPGTREKKGIGKAKHTIITIGGKKYELLNSLDEKEKEVFLRKYPIFRSQLEKSKEGDRYKFVIGEGNFGKVRLARELKENGEYCVVKKTANTHADLIKFFEKLQETAKEAQFHQEILTPKLNSKPELDAVVVRLSDVMATTVVSQEHQAGSTKETPKIYQFLKLMGAGDLKHIAEKIKKDECDDSLYYMAKEIIKCAAVLHKFGLNHRDIKLDNFLASKEGDIKISDFGASHEEDKPPESVRGKSDNRYWPPILDQHEKKLLALKEKVKDLKKTPTGADENLKKIAAHHDNWALGMTLVQLYSVPPDMSFLNKLKELVIIENGQTIPGGCDALVVKNKNNNPEIKLYVGGKECDIDKKPGAKRFLDYYKNEEGSYDINRLGADFKDKNGEKSREKQVFQKYIATPDFVAAACERMPNDIKEIVNGLINEDPTKQLTAQQAYSKVSTVSTEKKLFGNVIESISLDPIIASLKQFLRFASNQYMPREYKVAISKAIRKIDSPEFSEQDLIKTLSDLDKQIGHQFPAIGSYLEELKKASLEPEKKPDSTPTVTPTMQGGY